jgi:iron-sulfur cluster repair protein YtfE (RIC family)
VPLTDRLRQDHQEFFQLGRAIETILRTPPPRIDRAQLRDLVRTFQLKLDAHSRLEDEEFYPAVRRVLTSSTRLTPSFMDHLDNEHDKIEKHLAKLIEQVSAPRLVLGWGQTFAVFSVGLRAHMKREEEELFPEAERLLGGSNPPAPI